MNTKLEQSKAEEELSKVLERLNPMFEEHLEKQRKLIGSLLDVIMGEK